jgi:hypothetical protein
MKLSAKSLALAAVVALGLPAAAPSFADQASDALGQCMVHATTPEDDMALVRWVFVMMSKHPKVADLAMTTPEKEDQINRQVGALFERLLTKDCADETKAAMATSKEGAFRDAFGVLGTKAFQSLESDPSVEQASQAFIKYVDMNKIVQVLIASPAKK